MQESRGALESLQQQHAATQSALAETKRELSLTAKQLVAALEAVEASDSSNNPSSNPFRHPFVPKVLCAGHPEQIRAV